MKAGDIPYVAETINIVSNKDLGLYGDFYRGSGLFFIYWNKKLHLLFFPTNSS
jgi:hypothetical protein